MQLTFLGGGLGRLQLWLVAFIVFLLLPVTGYAEQAAAPAQAAPEAAAAEAPAAVGGEVAGSGNYKAGYDLFTGARRLKNGAPPCISCHNAGVGSFGGGSLGPDLTKVWTDKFFLIDAAWINGEGVPVMGPIFSSRNITPEEVADLQAFFSVQAQKAAGTGGSKYVGGGVIIFIAFLIFISIVWSGRYRNRNKGTAHDALWRNYGGKGGR